MVPCKVCSVQAVMMVRGSCNRFPAQLPCNVASLAFPLECDRHFETLMGELRSDVDLALEKTCSEDIAAK